MRERERAAERASVLFRILKTATKQVFPVLSVSHANIPSTVKKFIGRLYARLSVTFIAPQYFPPETQLAVLASLFWQ